jgi:DNA mismatch endonuclease (patch repair protein)
MADVHTSITRSYNMSQIRSKNTRPELLVRKALFALGFRFRLHVSKLPGKPDIVLKKYNTIIFVHGCFWHGHKKCKYFVVPKTNTDWWLKKIHKTKSLDKKNILKLKAMGWKVTSIYECQLRKEQIERTINTLINKMILTKSEFQHQ